MSARRIEYRRGRSPEALADLPDGCAVAVLTDPPYGTGVGAAIYGHLFDDENTYLVRRADGSVKQRMCRECGRQRLRARRKAGRR